MKKILLASAITLSILGFTTAPSQAEENKNQPASVGSTVNEGNSDKLEDNNLPKKENTVATEVSPSSAPKDENSAAEIKKDGWVKEEKQWRFYENNKPVVNWKQIQDKWYFFDQNGNRLSNTTFDGYVFDKDGVMASGGWSKLEDKWYYTNSSGKISQQKWEKIGGVWYYFDKDGVMLSNTVWDGYLFSKSGAMVSQGWTKLEDKWFYVNASGKISQDKWEKVGGSWYYFDKDGTMLSNRLFNGYLFSSSGAMAERSWVKLDEKWYFAQASGRPSRDKWEKVGSSWYYFNKDATMASNQWQGSYYLKDSGAMASKEWIFDKNYNSWFYLKSDGTYAAREWIGSYYLKSGGYMAKSEWIDDSYYKARYYVDENGVYVTGTHKIEGQTHQFQSNGKWIGETSISRGFEKGKYNNIIFLDPGHGGKDPGAAYYNITEKELNMQVYRKLRKELEGLGYTVLTSRDSDVFVDFVTERSRMVNKTDSDIFISIHFNATGNPTSRVSGIQTYSYEEASGYPSKINPYWHNHPDRISESNRLAADIHSSLLAETGAKNAGLLQRSFAVLRETNKPAVLLELGYMDNFDESQRIRDSRYQDKLVAGIVKGIQKYYAGQ